MKEWISPVYAFFEPTPCIVEINGRRAHEFKCGARGCKTTIRQFLDKKDAQSTGNMRKHVKSCWGNAALMAADDVKDANEVRTKIVTGILWDGSITESFERKGKGKVTYSHRQHTHTEAKYIIKLVIDATRKLTMLQSRNSPLGIRKPGAIQDRKEQRISVIDEDWKARVSHTFPNNCCTWCQTCICAYMPMNC